MRGQSDLQLVFIYLLAHTDAEGHVEMIPDKISDDTGLGLERTAEALRQLALPDPRSRSSELEGSRIEPIDDRGWGWKVVNHKYYRGLKDAETARLQTRERMRRYRGRVTERHQASPLRTLPHAEAEAEAEAEAQSSKPSASQTEKKNTRSLALAEREPEGFEGFYRTYPRRVGRRAAAKAFAQALKRHSDLDAGDLANAASWYAGGAAKELEQRFVPHPATWLNQDRFLEEYAESEAKV